MPPSPHVALKSIANIPVIRASLKVRTLTSFSVESENLLLHHAVKEPRRHGMYSGNYSLRLKTNSAATVWEKVG
jgi:hypothetical protein